MRTIFEEKAAAENLSIYRIAKDCNIPYTTTENIIKGRTDIYNSSFGNIAKITNYLHINIEDFFEEKEDSYDTNGNTNLYGSQMQTAKCGRVNFSYAFYHDRLSITVPGKGVRPPISFSVKIGSSVPDSMLEDLAVMKVSESLLSFHSNYKNNGIQALGEQLFSNIDSHRKGTQ